MPNYKVTPIWRNNWLGVAPVYSIGNGEASIVNGQLDLRRSYLAMIFIQLIHRAHTASPNDPGIQIRIKREVGCLQNAPPWEGRVGEITQIINSPLATSSVIQQMVNPGDQLVYVPTGEADYFQITDPESADNIVALYSSTYSGNLEFRRVSQVQATNGPNSWDTIKLDAPLAYLHKQIFSDNDRIYKPVLCLDPIEIPGGAMYNLAFECLAPIEANYYLRWWANIYDGDKPEMISI